MQVFNASNYNFTEIQLLIQIIRNTKILLINDFTNTKKRTGTSSLPVKAQPVQLLKL